MADINLGVGGANSAVAGGYDIANSAAFGGANGIQFNPSSDGNRRTWTVSLWVKRSELSVQTTIFGASNTEWTFMSTDWLRFGLHTGSAMYYYDTDNTGTVFRDTSAWYHLVFQLDTTQAVAANRTKLYINGELYTGARGGADTSANIPQNTEMTVSLNTTNIQVGYFYAGGAQLDGYMSEIHFTDGVANDADAFGEYDNDSGIWKPKAYEGSYGTNGFYLEFKEPAASSTGIGKDTSGNGHNFSTGGTYPSQATDTPTNNFCTLNQAAFTLTDATISQGATSFFNTLSDTRTAVATMAVTKGKWYFEYKFISSGGSTYWSAIGFTNAESTSSNLSAGSDSDSSVLLLPNGTPYENGTIGSSNFSYFTTNDIAGVALDVDNGNMYLYKNGTIQNSGNPIFTSIGDFIMPLGTTYANGCGGYFNFGGFTSYTPASPASDENGYGTFEYAPPSGYYAICTKNLAEYG